MTTIFISYRRADNADFVERIADKLMDKFGQENVFIDFYTIPPGVKFADYIREKVREAHVIVPMIGPDWVALMKEKAASFQEDFVRVELELALQLGKPFVPVCIKGARAPSLSDVPTALHPIFSYNVAFIDSGRDYFDNIGRIIGAVEAALTQPQTNRGASEARLREADRKFDTKDYDGVIRLATEAIRYDPSNARAYSRRGAARINKGDLDGGLEDFNSAIMLDPHLTLAYNNRGIARRNKGDIEGALADFEFALHLDPDDVAAYYNRAFIRVGKGDLKDALSDFDALVRLDPDNAPMYNARGYIRYQLGDLNGALSDYETALRLDPQLTLAQKNREIVQNDFVTRENGTGSFTTPDTE